MNTLQDAMLNFIHLVHPQLRRLSPRQKYNPTRPHLRHRVNDLLRELLPSFARMAIWFVCTHRKARVEQQDAAVGPGGQETAIVGWGFERGVVLREGLVHVLEGRRRADGRADGEAEAVGLVDVVVRVLTKDDGFDCVKGSMARPAPVIEMRTGIEREREREGLERGVKLPGIDIFRGRENCLVGLLLLLQEPLQLQEFLAQHLVFQLREP